MCKYLKTSGLLIMIFFFVCAGLTFLILIQPGESAGLSSTLGGGSSQKTIFGARSSTFMVRATAVLGSLFLIICLLLAILSSRRQVSLLDGAASAPPAAEPAAPAVVETEGEAAE